MKKQLTFMLAILLVFVSTFPERTHTIYIAGPTAQCNVNWQRESKIIYRLLKAKAAKTGSTIEFFPKKKYRKHVTKKRRRKLIRNVPTQKELTEKYRDIERLYEDLLELIFMRYQEVATLSDSDPDWDDKIHLKAYGKGGELLLKVVDSRFSSVLGSLIAFDNSDSDSFESVSTESPRIVNITIKNEDEENTTHIALKTATAIVILVGALIALL